MAPRLFPASQAHEGVIRHRFDEAVSQEIERHARGMNRLRNGDALLNIDSRELGVRADGAVIHQRAAGDDHSSVRDGDLGILEAPVRPEMTDAQPRDLAAAIASHTTSMVMRTVFKVLPYFTHAARSIYLACRQADWRLGG